MWFPAAEPDAAAIGQAVEAADYAAFRRATYEYEEPLRKRIGRWVARYPHMEAQIGTRFSIDDIVESVLLDAFESYTRRPDQVRLGDWLEGLIDPALQRLQRHAGEELENVNAVRSLQG
jgi:hypothetical protein